MRITVRRARRSAVVAFLSILTLLATALPAFAHHPEISATPHCADDGRIRVDFTAETWTSTGSGGLHDDIRVGWSSSYRGGGAQSTSPFDTQVATGSFTDPSRSFSGSFHLPADMAGDDIWVTSWAVGRWGNDNAGNEYRSVKVTLPGECVVTTTAVDPTVRISDECEVPDTLTVPNTTGVEYLRGDDVVNGQTFEGPQTVTLTARAADGHTLTNPQWTYGVTLEGAEDCDELVQPVAPTVERADECDEADSLRVPVTTGVIYALTQDGADVSGQTLTGPRSATLFARAADGYTLGEATGWTHQFQLGGGEDCATTTTVTVECDEDRVVVAVDTNENAPIHATIDGDQVEVVNGEAVFTGLADGTYTVVVTNAQGEEIDRETFTIDCDEPEVGVSDVECTEDGGTVVVTVDETPADTFFATIGDEMVEVVDGQATFTGLADGTHSVTVMDSTEQVVFTDELVVDCDEPEVDVTTECVDGDGTVVVTVDETPAGDFTATIGDTMVGVVDGQASFGGIEDGTHTVTVRDEAGDVVATLAVVVDCDEPEVEVVTECVDDAGTVTVTIIETPDDEAFTVTVDGDTVELVDGVATIAGLADGDHTVVVTSDQGLEETVVVTVDCEETGVGGVDTDDPDPAPQPEPAPEPEPEPKPAPEPEPEPKPAPEPEPAPVLAATGVATSVIALAALFLLALGGSMVSATRARRSGTKVA